jgi:hypothetical protein
VSPQSEQRTKPSITAAWEDVNWTVKVNMQIELQTSLGARNNDHKSEKPDGSLTDLQAFRKQFGPLINLKLGFLRGGTEEPSSTKGRDDKTDRQEVSVFARLLMLTMLSWCVSFSPIESDGMPRTEGRRWEVGGGGGKGGGPNNVYTCE